MLDITFRRATSEDVPVIVKLLADDQLGAGREDLRRPLPESYYEAFNAIDSNPHHILIVGDKAGSVVACLQLTFLPGLSHQGAWRAQIEGVRVSTICRGHRVGEALIRYALELARQRGCRTAQLTTDKRRADAHRFYARLGFTPSHEGMKLSL
ncbi:MAG: GNAT family N-acetyltransferase [Alphaproteobacteria bacterium]